MLNIVHHPCELYKVPILITLNITNHESRLESPKCVVFHLVGHHLFLLDKLVWEFGSLNVQNSIP